ncbi:MAG: hypothetical protein JW755_08760 [Candidatus Aminicenantes bacterium]|nr:hypothetical protein [Candidatus Aminicenantes bacterium]
MIWDSKNLIAVKDLPWFLFFGSLWGINELITGEILSAREVESTSLILTAMAIFILAVSRGLINKPGSSTLIGIIALLFKLIHVAPFYCHLAAIFLLGFIFDLFSSVLLREKRVSFLKQALNGSAAAFFNNAVFGIFMTYVFRYKYWITNGNQKMIEHILTGGSLLAFISLFFSPLGFKIGVFLKKISLKQPAWALAASSAGSIAIWLIGRFAS